MLVTTSYSQKEEKAAMEIHYSGEAFDPRQTDNILSQS